MNYEELLRLFFQNSNRNFDEFNNKIINSGVKTIGCTVPFVRSVAKKIADKLDEVVTLPIHQYYEVDLFKGMVVSATKLPFESKRHYLDDFADTIENWAVCDCNTVKVSKAEREVYFEYFCNLCTSDKPFVCRYGLVNLLSSYLDDLHIQAVFEALRGINTWGHYYVDMAVAWLVATAMARCKQATVAFMENDARAVLNEFAFYKALQKMRDSYRVSAEDKQWTKTLKY